MGFNFMPSNFTIISEDGVSSIILSKYTNQKNLSIPFSLTKNLFK